MTLAEAQTAHRDLKRLIGGWAYRALLAGRPLQVWRNSSPHNYWVENARGAYLWHSEDGGDRPDLRLFRKPRNRSARVIQYWGADSGMPRHSFYRLRRRGACR